MNSHNKQLPQLEGDIFLTDGGLETTLIFQDGFELPHFAAFDLLSSSKGQRALSDYFRHYAAIASRQGTGLVLETPTWRASPDWGKKLGYDSLGLERANRAAVRLLEGVRREYQGAGTPIVISGCIGPREDGYVKRGHMTPAQAMTYHEAQVHTFAETGADMVSGVTMTYPEEAIGVVLAAQKVAIPVVISFTTETDGRLPNGQSLREAIERVDAATGNGPVYYMINCAHPDHFSQALKRKEQWVSRIHGIRANASRQSHAELDEAEELDPGNPRELAQQYKRLRQRFPQFKVLGGCCGTDHRHIHQIGIQCAH